MFANKLLNKILENKQIALLILILIVLILALSIGYVIRNNNHDNKAISNTIDSSKTKNQELSSSDKVDDINKFAKEKYPKSVLVQVADNQGQSSVFTTVGEKDKSFGNKTGNADSWMYIYIKDPSDIKINEDDNASIFGKYNIKQDQGFIIELSNNEISLKKDILYSDLNLYSINDISEDLKKITSVDSYQKAFDSWKDQVKSYNYSDDTIQDVDLVFQNIAYEKPEETDKEEIKGTWQVNIIYKDENLEQKKRTFFTRILSDGNVKKGIVYPL